MGVSLKSSMTLS